MAREIGEAKTHIPRPYRSVCIGLRSQPHLHFKRLHYPLQPTSRHRAKATAGQDEPSLNNRGAFDSAKNHKRQRRKRQSVTAKREKSQTPKSV